MNNKDSETFDAVLALLKHIHPCEDFQSLREEMIFRFSSANAMFAADRHIWQHMGLKPNDALLLSRIPDITRYADQAQHSRHPRLNTLQSAVNYLVSSFHGLQTEHFYMFCLDKRGCLKEKVFLYEGTADCTLLNMRKLLREAVRVSPAMIILSHNHPGGTTHPSQEDISSTRDAMRALSVMGIPVLDHIIIAGSQAISMRTLDCISELEWAEQQPDNRFLCTWPDCTGE